MKYSNWSNYPVIEAAENRYVPKVYPNGTSWIPRGMGRCYGDASLGTQMISSANLNRLLDFDPISGALSCESGVTFEDLLETFVPQGWFPPVTPGTKFVSLGGAIASDVHGKNHHVEGSISRHVSSFDLLLPSGKEVRCSREQQPELFEATFGGMGLTGMVLRLTLQLKRIETAYIQGTSLKARNLTEILELFDEFESATYSVAWIDCVAGGKKLGRSILHKGEHASLDQLPLPQQKTPLHPKAPKKRTVPVYLPNFTLNPLSIKAFNRAYYHKQFSQTSTFLKSYEPFFYPLDAIHHWNRIYGRRGFIQYQFVIPREAGKKGLEEILKKISKQGQGSFLAVLKLFGPQSGMMSFPMEGYTLALDFPVSQKLFPFLDELDHQVADYGGRVYLSKDARLSPEMLRNMYPNLGEFQRILQSIDPKGKMESLLSQRLQIRS